MLSSSHSIRFSHIEGHTEVDIYQGHSSAPRIVTAGCDGDIRLYEGFNDDDPTSFRGGETISAVAIEGNNLYFSSDDNSISVLLDDGTPDGILARFTGLVTQISLSPDGKYLAACSEDFTVRIVNLASRTAISLQAHDAPVLSVSISPDNSKLASASCDGSVKVWELDTQLCLNTFENISTPSNEFSLSKGLCRLTWTNQGKFLLAPCEKVVKIFSSESWRTMDSLTCDLIDSTLSIVKVSSSGDYVAASSISGQIVIWEWETKKCVSYFCHLKKQRICSLAWINDGLIYCDIMGQLGLIERVTSPNMVSSKDKPKEFLKIDNQENDQIDESQFDSLFDDDDDALISSPNDVNTHKDNVVTNSCIAASDNLGEDSNDIDIGQIKRDNESFYGLNEDVVTEPLQPIENSSQSKHVPPISTVKSFEPTPMQPTFQPGSTPSHLQHRFMVWNSVGVIRQYNTDDENSIDIEFHDTSTHHSIHVTNSLDHTMADISSQAVLLGSQGNIDENTFSQIVCMHYSSWDNCKEWSSTLPEGEILECLCLGEDWLAIASDKQIVRIFSIGGVQKQIFSIPGPVLAMTAHSNQLLITFHSALALPGDQCISYQLMQVVKPVKSLISDQRLPISRKSKLSWIGFTAEGTPISADSLGVVRMMNRKYANSWFIIANTKQMLKNNSDNYFIVGAFEKHAQLRCILCKGSKYPFVLPRPSVTLLDFNVPVCDAATDKGLLEEKYWRNTYLSGHFDFWKSQNYEVDEQDESQSIIEQQEHLMKLFALACKTGREFRAVELCRMMPGQYAVQLAIKYASRMRLIALADKLNEVAREKVLEEQSMAEEEENYSTFKDTQFTTSLTSQPIRRFEKSSDSHEVSQETAVACDNAVPVLDLDVVKKSKDSTPNTLLMSQENAKKNPFKSNSNSSTPVSSSSIRKGSHVFDSVAKKQISQKSDISNVLDKPKMVSLKKRVQPKLFEKETSSNDLPDSNEPVQEMKSGFQIWFETVRDKLFGESNLSESELTLNAALEFKNLPAEQKKEWLAKAKNLRENSQKRKRDDQMECKENECSDYQNQDCDNKQTSEKNLLSDSLKKKSKTSNKLSTFSFNKMA